jgi:two-component system sensor kinase FixL
MASSDKQRKRAEPARSFAKRRKDTPFNPLQKHADGALLSKAVFSDTLSLERRALELEFAVDALREREAALKASESALKQAQHLVALGNWEWDLQTGRHIWSEEIYRIYGRDTLLPPAAYPEVKQYFTAESWEGLNAAVEKALREGVAYVCDAEVVRPDGARRWITARGQPTRDADGSIISLHGTVQDITERKRSEQRIAQLNRAQAILAAVDHAIVHIQDRQRLLDEICRVAAEKGGFKLVWIGVVFPDGTVRPVSAAGETEYLEGIRVVVHDVPDGRGPVGTAIRENLPVVIDDIEHDPRMRPWRERARRFGLHYVAAFPIQIAGKTAASLQLYAPRAGFFDENEISLLKQVSNDISFALTAIEAIAERKRAEQELRKSEQELADFFEASPLGMLWVGPEGRILRANRAELELLARTSDEVLGRLISDFHVEPEVAWDVLKRRNDTLQNHRARIRQRDGTIKHILIDANGYWEGEQLIHSRWFVRDITHRIELEREILTISEREQRRLGHDLHDDLCQQLAGIEFLSQTLASDLAANAAVEAGQAREIAQSVQNAMTQTRELARGLSPVGMEAEGLMEGLRQLAERTSKIFRLECHFRCPTSVLVPDHAVAIHLYRIAQEAVGNAIKHAKAGSVTIALAAVGNNLRLGVTDDGIGIPRTRPKTKGMGLRIMQYRAGVIGGSLVVQRNPDGGTTVVCTVTGGLLPPRARNLG